MTSIAAMLDPTTILRAFYLGSAITLLLVSRIPPLRDHFIDYGSRQDPANRSPYPRNGTRYSGDYKFLDWLSAALQVPHSWFKHFYALSLACCLFWAYQILFNGSLFQFIATHARSDTSMTKDQVMVAWGLMTAHSIRRLYETTALTPSTPKSKSTMWLGHYVLGMAFYLTVTLAIWLDGAPALAAHTWSMHDFTLRPPAPRSLLALPLFALASGMQHDFHAYLASLKKYSLPDKHPLWALCVCPHYFAECLLYAALAIIAAPKGSWVNWTLVTACVFVVVNLSITAARAQRWYADKFTDDKEAILRKAKIFPGIY